MIYIETKNRDAAFHFALEEFIMRDYPFAQPVMMIWQTGKCVMLGNNQSAEAEVDMGYLKREGILLIRRSSGGGAIFADPGTVFYTVILPHDKDRYPLTIAKEDVAEPVVQALRKMGVPAVVEGRNDILTDGKKISGFAQYSRYGRICTHGSLLYETDLDALAQVLQPDEKKIRTKALRSVRSRVANIKEYMNPPCSTLEFRDLLRRYLLSDRQAGDYFLTEHDIEQINEINVKKYLNPSWTYEQSPAFSFHNGKRFTGGKVEVYFDITKGAVSSCSIQGDFLGVIPISGLERVFEGKRFTPPDFCRALDGIELQPYLGEITKEELLSCVFEYL